MTDGALFHVIIQRFLVNNNFNVMCKSCSRICLRSTVFRMLEFCWIFTRSYLFVELDSFPLSLIHSNNIFFDRVINVENTRIINKPVLYFLRSETWIFFRVSSTSAFANAVGGIEDSRSLACADIHASFPALIENRNGGEPRVRLEASSNLFVRSLLFRLQ